MDDAFCIDALNEIAWQYEYISELEWSATREAWLLPEAPGELADVPGTLENVLHQNDIGRLVREVEFLVDLERACRLSQVLLEPVKLARETYRLSEGDDRIPRRAEATYLALGNAAEHCWLLREMIVERSRRTTAAKSALCHRATPERAAVRSDEPTEAQIKLARDAYAGMSTKRPSVPAFRAAARAEGLKASNAKLGRLYRIVVDTAEK